MLKLPMMRRMVCAAVIAALGLTIGGVSAAAGKGKAKAPAAAAQSGDPAEFLIKPAEQAVKDRKYELGISLWKGVVAMRGDGDESAWKLAEVWTLAGEFDDAADVLARYSSSVTDAAKKAKADEEITSLRKRERGFSTKKFQLVPATEQAKQAFKLGLAAFKKKKYDLAAMYYKAGIEMAPDLPGNYRELGEALDKLGRSAEANDFFVRYLLRRPFGKNADVVRDRLAKAKLVGKLSIESTLPCDEVWINRQPIPKKLPIKEHVVAPGKYKVLCFNEKYHHAQYESVEVKVGDNAKIVFNWAIVQIKLEPWGRVVLENPYDKSEMRDIGLWEEIGVPIPSDRRALRAVITAGDGSKKKEEFIKLEPGKTFVLKW